MADVEFLTTRYHVASDGWSILNAAGEVLGRTMLPPSQIINEVAGATMTDKLRALLDKETARHGE